MVAGADHTVTTWRKSSYSGGNCVEVGATGPVALVRDTTNRAGAVLEFGPAAWHTFAAGLKTTPRA